MRDSCVLCTRLTDVIEVGKRRYCYECMIMRLRDPDGKEEFKKMLDKYGIFDIETDGNNSKN